MPTIEGVAEKLIRAQEHLISLDEASTTFFDKKPYVLNGKHNRDGTQYVVTIRFTESIPTRISVLVGDVLYQLRSSLDHIAWALAEAGSGGSPDTEFPIILGRDDFFATEEDGQPKRGSGLAKIAGITDTRARTFIEAVQPFYRPPGERA